MTTSAKAQNKEQKEASKNLRLRAMAEGKPTYVTGYSCVHGHTGDRYAKSGVCVACSREHAARRQRENPEWAQARNNRWRAKNPDAMRRIQEEHYQQNKPQYRARTALYRARKQQATPPWADLASIEAVYEAARRLTLATGYRHEVDHIVPLKGKNVCGLHVAENLQVLPMRKNRSKGNKTDHCFIGGMFYSRNEDEKINYFGPPT